MARTASPKTAAEDGTHIALLYSDGSLGVCRAGMTLEGAHAERKWCDKNEADPAQATKIVRVRCEITETLFDPNGLPAAPQSEVDQLRQEVAALKARLGETVP